MASDAVAAGYAQLLAREPWHWFATLTFSPTKVVRDKWSGKDIAVNRYHPLRGMHLEAADKAWRWWVFEINKAIYGNNWRRIPHGGIVWARGQEFHKSGKVHFHGVLAAPDGDLNRMFRRDSAWRVWFREFGRNRIEAPRDQDDVVGYVSKYVAKDGEVDFSRNFGTATPPRLFDGWSEGRASLLKGLASVDDRSRRGQGEMGGPEGRNPSLTLPVRPQETQSQAMFTHETYFETQRGKDDESDDRQCRNEEPQRIERSRPVGDSDAGRLCGSRQALPVRNQDQAEGWPTAVPAR